MKREHDWRTYCARPGRSYDDCARKGCTAKSVMRNWKWRQTAGPKECGEREK